MWVFDIAMKKCPFTCDLRKNKDFLSMRSYLDFALMTERMLVDFLGAATEPLSHSGVAGAAAQPLSK